MRVPFGRRTLIGIALGMRNESEVPIGELRSITEVLDVEPLLSVSFLQLLGWAAQYYHYPIGEVLTAALPVYLRKRDVLKPAESQSWSITPKGAQANPDALRRAPVQRRILLALQSSPQGLATRDLAALSRGWRAAVETFSARGWISPHERDRFSPQSVELLQAPTLTESQAVAVQAILDARGFKPFLLHGVTGSGKTEVYIRVVDGVLARREQVLVLVPEIGLTPQLVARFRQRFRAPLAVLHSDLTDQERAHAWLSAQVGKAQIVIGTRSAIFTPLPRLGAIVVDEEHDPSYKQQEGFRYSARDVAIMRASRESIPIVLGSATPSLETLNRVRLGSYTELVLPNRAGGADLPAVELLDMRRLAVEEGLSHPLRVAVEQTLRKGEQTLLFLNRRGFAPVWMCFNCAWVAPCSRCDARLTFHRASARLRCHHCGADHSLPRKCPTCEATELHALGEGTERVESALGRMYPHARIVRIDRDSTRAKGSLHEKLERVRRGDADILIGTQMLSKGHDFPNVTLVGVVNADQGLYGSDFRAAERLVQQIVQVSGRAGRAAKTGRVLIQTYHPAHPVFAALQARGYDRFADYALTERRSAGYPPFCHFALLRAESAKAETALAFLRVACELARRCAKGGDVQVMEPVPSPMERRAGRYRAQLLIQSTERKPLHATLDCLLARLDEAKTRRHVRWAIDVDPADMY